MELNDVDVKKINFIFKRIGVDLPILPKGELFESDQLPARALALSNRFGYIFFAHSRGFTVAKTADLLEFAEKLKANANESKTAQEAGTVTVAVTNIHSLALSSDELTVCVCAGGDVMFYDLATLVHKSDKRPFEVRKVDLHDDPYAKDFLWSPSESEVYLILTSQGKLLLGNLGSAPECKVDKGVVAASWSADGQHIAYVADSRRLNITTSKFAIPLQHELPNCLSDDDDDSDDLHVDAIRWVRPDNIVIAYLRVNSEGEEDQYPLFVLHSRNGNLVQEDSNLEGLVFYQVFPSIDPFVVPSGSGPYMLSDYIKPWEFMLAASRKSIDDHIVLMGWFREDGRDVLYSLELGNEIWVPRIELQESGEDNAILGLAIDRTTVQIQLPDPTDETGDTILPPGPVLVCLTLEGKLSFFSVARLGERSDATDVVTPPSNVPDGKRSIPQPSSQLTSKEDISTALIPFSPTVIKVEPPKVEIPKVEPATVEAPKLEPPKVEQPKVQQPKVEPSKVEQLKVEPPKDGIQSSELTAQGEDNDEPSGQTTIMTMSKPAVKDERDSLFERLTRPPPSFPKGAVGDHPSESSRSGLTDFPEDVKNSMSIPTSPSVMTLRDLTGVVNVASKKDYFEGLFRPFEDASKSGIASVKSAPQLQRVSQLSSVGSSLPVASIEPLQSVQSGPVPTAIARTDLEDKDSQGGFVASPPVAFGQGSQGRGFQGGPAANVSGSFGQGSQGKGFQGGPASNPAVSFGPGSQGKGFQGGPAANPTASFGPSSQGKGFQGDPAANATVSFGSGSQGRGFQGGPAANPANSFGRGAQGKDSQVGPAANPTVPFGASVKSPLGSTAPKLSSNQRGAERFTHSSRILQDAAGRAAGVTDMEAAFNAELEDVREMSEKVDQLMSYIDGRWHRDAYDKPMAFTRQSLEELEQDIHRLSQECKEFRGQINQNKEEIEDLRDEEMRVDAWRIYIQSLMDQKSDSRYQELWNSQKLHPELEMKRKRLLKADQGLKQHIAELEGHLHILELKQFQQGNTRRRSNKPVQSPGRFLSIQNLYNAVNAQMAVADELSNSLAHQMEALNIKWSPQTPKSTASKILKSVGADTDDPEYVESPLPRTRLSYSPMPKRGAMNGLSAFPVQDEEPSLQQTTRRRRDSMDVAWVNRETPKTTIKRVVRTRPSQNVSPVDSTLSKFRQRLQPLSDVPSTESFQFSKTAKPAQSTRMGASSATPSFPDPGFEDSVSSFRPTGMFASGFQWQSSQLEEQQRRPGPAFPSGDLRGSSSATYQGSGSEATTTSTNESMFKWSTAVSKPIPNAPPSTVISSASAKQYSQENFDDTRTGVMANSRGVLPAAKPTSFGTSGGFNFAEVNSFQLSFGKSDSTDNFNKTDGAFLGTSNSSSFSKMGTGVGHRLGTISSGGSDSDHTGGQASKGNEMLEAGFSAKPTSRLAGVSPVSLSTGVASTNAPHFGGHPSTSVMTGPTPFSQISKPTFATGASKGSSSTSSSLSFQAAQSRNAEKEPQKREEEFKLPTSKGAAVGQFPSFSKVESTEALTATLNTPESKRDFDLNTKQVIRVQSDLANLAEPQQASHEGPLSLFSGAHTERPFDQNSSAPLSSPSTGGASSLSILSSTTPHISPPAVQTPDGTSVFASTKATPGTSSYVATDSLSNILVPKASESELGTPVKTGAAAAASASPFNNLGSKLHQEEPETPGKTGAAAVATAIPIANMEQQSLPVAKLAVGTPAESKGLSSMSSGDMAVSIASIAGAPATTDTKSVFSTPTVVTGLFPSSSSATGSAFTTSTTSVPNQASESAFSIPTPSASNQSSGSVFASSSLPAFQTSSSQSISPSPFGQSSAFGQSNFGQASGFGQSAQQPMQQPFTFPGSSASSMVSNAATSLPSVESNEEDMEEEASTGIGNTSLGTFGGFGGLGLGSSATEAQTQKANPFGVSSFGNSQPFQLTPAAGGQLFRPATFSLPAAQSSPQQAGGTTFGSGFGSSGFSQNNAFSEPGKAFGSPPQSTGVAFGQPAQLGPGQQALGSALGAFGQTRQVGFGTPYGHSGMGSASGVGFANATPGRGFASAATGAGFAGAAMGAGFAGAATGSGFAGAAAGSGFAGLSGGQGFQSFGGNQGASPGFGSGAPPAQFTQMRK